MKEITQALKTIENPMLDWHVTVPFSEDDGENTAQPVQLLLSNCLHALSHTQRHANQDTTKSLIFHFCKFSETRKWSFPFVKELHFSIKQLFQSILLLFWCT